MPKITKPRLHFFKVMQRKPWLHFFRTRCISRLEWNSLHWLKQWKNYTVQYYNDATHCIRHYNYVLQYTVYRLSCSKRVHLTS